MAQWYVDPAGGQAELDRFTPIWLSDENDNRMLVGRWT